MRVGGAVGDYGASGGGDGGSVLGAGSLGVLVGRSGGGGWRKVPFGALRLLLGRLSLGGFRRVRSTDACRKRTRGHGIRQNPHPVAKSATRVGHPQFFSVVAYIAGERWGGPANAIHEYGLLRTCRTEIEVGDELTLHVARGP